MKSWRTDVYKDKFEYELTVYSVDIVLIDTHFVLPIIVARSRVIIFEGLAPL